MANLSIHQFICRSDNFGVLLHDAETGATAAIDAPDEAAISAELARLGWHLTDILITHHHLDHVEGLPGLKATYGARVVGPKAEAGKIGHIDIAVEEGDAISFAGRAVEVLDVPGHTLGHIALHLPEEKLAFVGDTLFALGCGRILEGAPRQMWTSLVKIAGLPGDTSVYCGHEYTLSNGRFALSVDGDNEALIERMKEVEALRAADKPTLPTTIAEEIATNPFLRASAAAVKQRLGMASAAEVDVFARLRQMKNDFKG
ncbi:MAG: hydroxyacylglutathione hydrolase [Ancalomicrobiaceae bacterium]|nr:hydroxyacylglutathione hydrolase [Ancalomicrobiaceae bacterium]